MGLTAADICLITCYTIIFVIGTLGNGFVYYIFKFKLRKTLKTMEILICYLALVDFFSSIINPLLFTYWQVTHYEHWHFGKISCKLMSATSAISVNVSIGLILLITLDKCRLICQPFKPNFSKTQARVAVVIAVAISVVVNIPYIINTDLMAHHRVDFTCYDRFGHFSPGNDLDGNKRLDNRSQSSTRRNATHFQFFNFSAYMTCENIEKEKITLSIATNRKKLFTLLYKSHPLTTYNTTACNRSCKVVSLSCNPPQSTKSFLYIESAIFVIQMFVFFSVFIASITLIHRTLYDKESLKALSGNTSIDRRKVFVLLVSMSTVFVVLAFPKNLFRMIYAWSWVGSNGIPYAFAKDFNSFLTVLQISNSVCNPFIYARLHLRFRQQLKFMKRFDNWWKRVKNRKWFMSNLSSEILQSIKATDV